MSSSPNQAQATFWEDVAGTWLASLGHVALIGSPFGRIAMERLGPIGGARVLDIGCGSGDTTVELARRVGPGGRAVGVDIAPSMIASATARAGELGVSNIEFMVADVQEAPLEAKSFDAAFSQFGVMFFEDPVAAFANVRRLIGDEGVCCFACWQNLFVNEWMMVPGAAILEATGHLDSLVSLGARTGPVRDFLRDADDAIRHRVVHDVRGKLRERVASGTLRLSAAAFVVRAEG